MPNNDQIYEALQHHLDSSPVGFPATPSGAHLTVLKHFFTPQEARIAASLSTMKLETAAVIHRRLKRNDFKISLDTLREKLDDMARRGTILVYNEGFKERHYKNAGVTAGGIFDFQVNRLSKELVDTFHQYHEEIFARAEMTGSRSIPQLRTIPVARSIPTPEQRRVSTYDDVRRILEDSPVPSPWLTAFAARPRTFRASPAPIPISARPACKSALTTPASMSRWALLVTLVKTKPLRF